MGFTSLQLSSLRSSSETDISSKQDSSSFRNTKKQTKRIIILQLALLATVNIIARAVLSDSLISDIYDKLGKEKSTAIFLLPFIVMLLILLGVSQSGLDLAAGVAIHRLNFTHIAAYSLALTTLASASLLSFKIVPFFLKKTVQEIQCSHTYVEACAPLLEKNQRTAVLLLALTNLPLHVLAVLLALCPRSLCVHWTLAMPCLCIYALWHVYYGSTLISLSDYKVLQDWTFYAMLAFIVAVCSIVVFKAKKIESKNDVLVADIRYLENNNSQLPELTKKQSTPN